MVHKFQSLGLTNFIKSLQASDQVVVPDEVRNFDKVHDKVQVAPRCEVCFDGASIEGFETITLIYSSKLSVNSKLATFRETTRFNYQTGFEKSTHE